MSTGKDRFLQAAFTAARAHYPTRPQHPKSLVNIGAVMCVPNEIGNTGLIRKQIKKRYVEV